MRLRALQLFQHFLDQGVESDPGHLEIGLACLNLGEIENSVDQAEQVRAIRLNTVEIDQLLWP